MPGPYIRDAAGNFVLNRAHRRKVDGQPATERLLRPGETSTVAAPTPPPATTSGTYAPDRVWDYQGTAGLTQWEGFIHGGAPTVVTPPVAHPLWAKACRFTVNDGTRSSFDGQTVRRTELTSDGNGVASGNITRGTNQWWAWSTLWPSTLIAPASWLSILQWHHVLNGPVPAWVNVSRGSNPPRLGLVTAGADYDLGVIALGQWSDYVVNMVWHDDPTIAKCTFKVNGVVVLNNVGVQNLVGDGSGGVQKMYVKQGLYGNRYSSGTTPEPQAVIHHTGLRRGPTEASITR